MTLPKRIVYKSARNLRDLLFGGGGRPAVGGGGGDEALTVFVEVGGVVCTLLGAGGSSGTSFEAIFGVAGVLGEVMGPRGTPALFLAVGLLEPGRKAGSELRMPGFASAKCLRDTAFGMTW